MSERAQEIVGAGLLVAILAAWFGLAQFWPIARDECDGGHQVYYERCR